MNSSRTFHPAICSDKTSNADLKLLLESGKYDSNSNHFGSNALHISGRCPNSVMYPRIKLLFAHGVNVNSKEYEYGNTPLHVFVVNENIAGVKFIIEQAKNYKIKIDFNSQDKQGKNCLILAAKMRHEKLAIYLLEQAGEDKNFNINLADENKMTALHYACALGMPQLAAALCKRGADLKLKNMKNQTAIDCTEMNEDNISSILKSVAIEPTRDEFATSNDLCDSNNQPPYIGIKDGKTFPCPTIASIKSNKDHAATLLKESIFDSEAMYLTQFIEPKLQGEAAVQHLANHLMSQTEKDVILRKFDAMSGTSCVKAAKRDQHLARNILIENGADYSWLIRTYAATNNLQLSCLLELSSIDLHINIPGTPSGKTALHQAAAQGHLAVCNQLIAKGANINATDSDGNTPIMLACLAKKSNIMLALAEMGTNVAIKNKADKTIFTLLNQTNQNELIAPLTQIINQVKNADSTDKSTLSVSMTRQ